MYYEHGIWKTEQNERMKIKIVKRKQKQMYVYMYRNLLIGERIQIIAENGDI